MKDENINDYINEVQMIGLRISYFRKLNGLTQRELADSIKIICRISKAAQPIRWSHCRC